MPQQLRLVGSVGMQKGARRVSQVPPRVSKPVPASNGRSAGTFVLCPHTYPDRHIHEFHAHAGVPATLTFPGTSAQKVVGIDMLHGFEQELIIEQESGNLVIHNFLIKDYPIILRLVE